MITLETLRSALLSHDAYEATDRLVRDELAAGRTTKQIFSELNAMLREARATPGLTEDGEEALFGTMDALTGDCHRDCQYKDPPNTTLPTEEEIAKLPRWAQVAFAARCARRALSLVDVDEKFASRGDFSTIFDAVSLAEHEAGAGISSVSESELLRKWARILHRDTSHSVIIRAYAEMTEYLLNSSSGTASSEDKQATGFFKPSFAASRVCELAHTLANDHTRTTLANRRDLDHIANLAEWRHWTDDTPAPPEVFGPLWPEGLPKDWPPISDLPQRTELPLAFFARERTKEQVIEDDVVNLFNAMNRYHIARGGAPLTYEDLRSLLPALVPAEV